MVEVWILILSLSGTGILQVDQEFTSEDSCERAAEQWSSTRRDTDCIRIH